MVRSAPAQRATVSLVARAGARWRYNARLEINVEQQMEVINDNDQDFGAGQVAGF